MGGYNGDGRRNLRYSLLKGIQRLLALTVAAIVLVLIAIFARASGYELPGQALWLELTAPEPIPPKQVALISGHAGFDSGAVCMDDDGEVTLTEAAVNANIVEIVAQRLRQHPLGLEVTILDEKDERLSGLQADLLLSLHSDSCVMLSGYKAVVDPNSALNDARQKLLTCIDNRYVAATQLAYHPTTITHDMVGYHAFGRIAPQTPAAILEMGFMGGDQALLTEEAGRVAQGIADSVICFLDNELWPEEEIESS